MDSKCLPPTHTSRSYEFAGTILVKFFLSSVRCTNTWRYTLIHTQDIWSWLEFSWNRFPLCSLLHSLASNSYQFPCIFSLALGRLSIRRDYTLLANNGEKILLSLHPTKSCLFPYCVFSFCCWPFCFCCFFFLSPPSYFISLNFLFPLARRIFVPREFPLQTCIIHSSGISHPFYPLSSRPNPLDPLSFIHLFIIFVYVYVYVYIFIICLRLFSYFNFIRIHRIIRNTQLKW